VEPFYVRPDGKYWAIYWGPILVCTVWSTEEGARLLCAVLEAIRIGRGFFDAWGDFCMFWRRDRSKPETATVSGASARREG
jgi:hypothetical protein